MVLTDTTFRYDYVNSGPVPAESINQSSEIVQKLNKLKIYFIKINICSLSKQAINNIRVKKKLGPNGQ